MLPSLERVHPSCQTVHQQVGAIPMRWRAGEPEILLITTRGKGRWMIPKGWALTETPNAQCAAREALEEAGVSGAADPHALGQFKLEKREAGARSVYGVTTYLLQVTDVRAQWQERAERKRCWFPLRTAQVLVRNSELAALLAAAVERFRSWEAVIHT